MTATVFRPENAKVRNRDGGRTAPQTPTTSRREDKIRQCDGRACA